jgi:ribonuclease P protein component
MKTDLILKKNYDFNKIINEGSKIVGKCFFVYYLPSIFFNNQNTQIGISVGKKLGKAHERNYQKRRIRQVLYLNCKVLKEKKIYAVIILRPLGKEVSFEKLKLEFSKNIKEIK